MKTNKIVSVLLLLTIILTAVFLPATALAQDETDTITLSTNYPTIEANSLSPFQFTVELTYKGATDRIFDIKTTLPQGWTVTVTPLYETTKMISSITMEGSDTGRSQSIQITAGSFYSQPEPGDYVITVEVASGDVRGNIDLNARVTARYSLEAKPTENLYSLKAKSGKNNVYSITVTNTGSAPIENVTLTADKTQGWEITFPTNTIDILEPGASQNIDLNIKPADKTVSGDYMVNVYTSGKQATAERISIRVTVETSSIWGWVGIIIIALVVIGLVFVFMRFGRR